MTLAIGLSLSVFAVERKAALTRVEERKGCWALANFFVCVPISTRARRLPLTVAILIEMLRCFWALAFSSINTTNCSTGAGIDAARIFIASSVCAHAPLFMSAPERREMAGVREASSYAIDGFLDFILVGTDALSGTHVSIDAGIFLSAE
jgi:hypothetical protein